MKSVAKDRPHGLRLINHSSRLVRWAIQPIAFFELIGRLIQWCICQTDEGTEQEIAKLVEHIYSSYRLRNYLYSPGIFYPFLGLVLRCILVLASAAIKLKEISRSGPRDVAVRVDNAVNAAVLRNLLIWQNEILSARPGFNDNNRPVDITISFGDAASTAPRMFDLASIALLLERFRSVCLLWHEDKNGEGLKAQSANSGFAGLGGVDDLSQPPFDVLSHVAKSGTKGGIRLLADGRKHANDYFKIALPQQLIVAVGLREDSDGAVESDELDRWLPKLEDISARHPMISFAVVNRVNPSQRAKRSAHIRFTRHDGFSLQHAISVAQTADAYLGALDIFGLAAFASGRSGVYVPLDVGRAAYQSEVVSEGDVAQIIVENDNVDFILQRFESLVANAEHAVAGAVRRSYKPQTPSA